MFLFLLFFVCTERMSISRFLSRVLVGGLTRSHLALEFGGNVTRQQGYNLAMARWWVGSEPTYWACVVNGTCEIPGGGKSRSDLNASGYNYWSEVWQDGPSGYWKAWNEWIKQDTPQITPCPSTLENKWPPSP